MVKLQYTCHCQTHDLASEVACMISIKEHYVVDGKGNKTSVILDIRDYKKILEELEELESLRAYDSAKVSGDEVLPFEEAMTEIERNRK